MPARATCLRPERALLHPSLLCALLVLGTNDHVLKGGGLLPGVVTGKLSDLAGLYAAPALFATVTRATTRRAVLACHVAVCVVFAALELCPRAAALWSRMFTALGLSWHGTADASDLLALPMLGVAYVVLVPRMGSRRVSNVASVSRLELGVLALGLLLCVATSPNLPPRHAENGSVSADTFVIAQGERLYVEVAMPTSPVDCERLQWDPRGALHELHFKRSWGDYVFVDEPQPFRREPRSDGAGERKCTAARIWAKKGTWYGEGDTLDPVLVAWETAKLPLRSLPYKMKRGEPAGPGTLILRAGKGEVTLTAVGPFVVVRE